MPAAQPVLSRLSRVPNGTVVGLGFAVAANLVSFAGAARVMTVVFVVGAIVIAGLLARIRPLAALEFAVWLWLLGPQVRRVVDHATGYHEPSLILVAAPLASLLMLPAVRRVRHRGIGRTVRPLLVTAAAIAAGYAVGALRVGLQPATAALLVWAVPVLFGLQVVAVTDNVSDLRATVDRVFIWGALIVGIYGVVQFYAIPSWDAYWMLNSSMNSIGTPEPFEVRVFSTLNSPGSLAMFLAAAVLYLADTGHRLRVPAQIVGYGVLALTLVRAAWLGCLLGLVVLLITGSARAKATVLMALALVTVAVLQISGPLQTVITDRIDETREGRQDDSFVARMALHSEIVPNLANDLLGQGLGASGSASQMATDGAIGRVTLDSGLLDFAYALGLPAALAALGTLVFGGMDLARIGLNSGDISAGAVAGALSVLVQMIGGNTLIGIGGITFFLLWGFALREVLEASKLGVHRSRLLT
jgi:hypothetical protein